MLSLLNLLALEATTASRSTTSSVGVLVSCLSLFGVTNFTVASSGGAYSTLLNFSIQNLRFSNYSLSKPAAIILPYTRQHLQSTVVCCRRASLAIRIRSGGHSYEGLSYLAGRRTPFAVVDLMNMNRVQVRLDSDTVWAESGATLGEIYRAIAESTDSLALSAGSCPTVGSGGHIAGGGFGLLSRKYGLAADNVVDAVLIDYTGRVTDRRTMGEDAFWAIRGGGGGAWGAVYAWKLRLRPVPKRVTSFIVNRPGPGQRGVAELVHKWQLVAPGLPDEFYISCFVGATLPESDRIGMSATFKGLFLGSVHEAIEILGREFPELGIAASDCHETSWIESVLFFSGLKKGSSVSDLSDRALHSKTFFKAKSDYVRSPLALPDLVSAIGLLATEPKSYLILDPYGGAMGRVRSDHLPFPHRSGNLYAIQYLVEWVDGQDPNGDRYIHWLREFYDHMTKFVSKGPRAAYVNYLDLDLGTIGSSTDCSEGYSDAVAAARAWGEKYFLGNYDRLVRAKTAVDPDNVFSNDQSIPPLSLASDVSSDSGHSVH